MSRVDDTKQKLAFSPGKIDLFRRILGYCVRSDGGLIAETDVLQLTRSMENNKLNMTQAEALLVKLKHHNWLVEHTDDDVKCVGLTGLSLAEFGDYLQENYSEVLKKCDSCKKITLLGYVCDDCKAAFHRGCASKFWDKSKKPPSCPSCKVAWPHVQVPNKRRRE